MTETDLFGFDAVGECIDFTDLFPDAFENKNGYGMLRATRGKLGGQAHVNIWEANNGRRPAGMVVMHLCNNRRCCNIDHLMLGTHAQNNYHAIDCGRLPGLDRYQRQKRHHQILFGVPDWIIANQFGQTAQSVEMYRNYHRIPRRKLLGKLTPRPFRLPHGKNRYGTELCTTMELF